MAVDYSKYLDGNSLKAIKSYIDNNFLKKTDISAWAKASTKPSYTHNEIGAGNLTIGDGVNTIFLRTNATWASAIYHQTTSDEAVVFLNKGKDVSGTTNYTTSWIFAYGTPSDRPSWTGLTPAMQIKGNSVVINKLLGSRVGASYNLDVNGTANATTIYENGTTLANKYQPKDADLTAIAGLSGTSGFLKKTAANTWSLDTNSYQPSHSLLSMICNSWDYGQNAGVLCGWTDDGGANFTGQPWLPMSYDDDAGNDSSPHIQFQWTNYKIYTGPDEYNYYNMVVRQKLKITRGDYFSPATDMVMYLGLTADRMDDSSSYRPAGIGFYNYILTANTTDTNDSSNNLRIFLLPSKSAGTHILATEDIMKPQFVNYTSISSRSLPSLYVGASGGYYLSPGTRNAARFYVGTVGSASNGIYVFTYAGIMLMFVCYGMTANIYYYSYGPIYDGSYSSGKYYYYIDSSGYLTIFSTSHQLPSGYTAYLHKLKLY